MLFIGCRLVCMAATSFVLQLSSFLNFFKDTVNTVLRYAEFLANSSVGLTLLVQKYNFMPVKLCYRLHFSEIHKRKENNEWKRSVQRKAFKDFQKVWKTIPQEHFKNYKKFGFLEEIIFKEIKARWRLLHRTVGELAVVSLFGIKVCGCRGTLGKCLVFSRFFSCAIKI